MAGKDRKATLREVAGVPVTHALAASKLDALSATERLAFRLAARFFKLDPEVLLNPTRSEVRIARARQLAMYLMHVVLSKSLTEVGQLFGRDRTTVRYACARIEDLRDLPGFDRDVAVLEEWLCRTKERREARAKKDAR